MCRTSSSTHLSNGCPKTHRRTFHSAIPRRDCPWACRGETHQALPRDDTPTYPTPFLLVSRSEMKSMRVQTRLRSNNRLKRLIVNKEPVEPIHARVNTPPAFFSGALSLTPSPPVCKERILVGLGGIVNLILGKQGTREQVVLHAPCHKGFEAHAVMVRGKTSFPLSDTVGGVSIHVPLAKVGKGNSERPVREAKAPEGPLSMSRRA